MAFATHDAINGVRRATGHSYMDKKDLLIASSQRTGCAATEAELPVSGSPKHHGHYYRHSAGIRRHVDASGRFGMDVARSLISMFSLLLRQMIAAHR